MNREMKIKLLTTYDSVHFEQATEKLLADGWTPKLETFRQSAGDGWSQYSMLFVKL